MLKPEDLDEKVLDKTYTRDQLAIIATEQHKLTVNSKETKPALIARILAAAKGESQPDQANGQADAAAQTVENIDAGNGEDDQDDADDDADLGADFMEDEDPGAPQASAVFSFGDNIEAHLREIADGLKPYIKAGLQVRYNENDLTWHFRKGNVEDSGTLNQPVLAILGCAKRILPRAA